jgi:phage host-nuclease inhibitor protein Gam
MAKTREKKVIHTGVSTEQMELAFADYARCDARIQKINAQIDIEMVKIREKYAYEISKNVETRDKSFDMLLAYATENKNDLFAKRKSLETTHGVFGFRTGTPKLKTLKGFTWPSVTNLLKEFAPKYVRTIDEPNKERLLMDRDDAELRELLPKVGISVVQDESFYVEPKKEE